MTLHRNPIDRLDHIERRLDQESLDDELRAEIEAELPSIYREYVALQSDDAFEQHLSRYVTQEYKKRQRGERDEPLCSCSLPTCPLTNGKIPAEVQYNPNALANQMDGRKRVLKYVQKHQGKEVLHEVLDTWDEREGELHRRIAEILSTVTQEHAANLRDLPTA